MAIRIKTTRFHNDPANAEGLPSNLCRKVAIRKRATDMSPSDNETTKAIKPIPGFCTVPIPI